MSEIPMYPDELKEAAEDENALRHEWERRCLEAERKLSQANEYAAGLAQLSTHLQSELDQQRARADQAEQVEDRVFALTTVLRDIRRKGLTQALRNEIDILLDGEVPSP